MCGSKRRQKLSGGFTLVETLIVMGIMGLITAGTLSALWQAQRLWRSTENELEGIAAATLALQKMIGGYSGKPGLRTAEWDRAIPSPKITTDGGRPTRISFVAAGVTNSFQLSGDRLIDKSGQVLCGNVMSVEFTQSADKPATVKVDLMIMFTGAFAPQRYYRLVSWVAMRNR
jgi:prepilin-type N-terminal cleavage/methylation domain-containing protein